jgi:hypothetical protein
MIKNKILRLVSLGVVIWLVPFTISFGFYDSTGTLTVSYALFKCLMIVTSSLISSYALLRYYKFVRQEFLKVGVLTGLMWLAINILLDLAILVPMAKMSYSDYFLSIGLGYVQIPVICITVGLLQERQFIMNSEQNV